MEQLIQKLKYGIMTIQEPPMLNTTGFIPQRNRYKKLVVKVLVLSIFH